jgi:hypothetical protein
VKPSRITLTVFAATLSCVQAQDRPAPDANNLPVKRVVLYKNGVGYFEHVGRVKDKQDVTIPFTSGQLNDVLKSLTVLDLDGGHITGVAYGSSAPVERQLGDLHLPTGDHTSLADFLGGLRGARLEIKNAGSVTNGRLLSVERKTRISGGTTLEVDYLSLITDGGELRTTEVSPGFSVRLLDKDLAVKVGRLLDIVSSGREADVRSMVISTDGTGARSLFVSYISEVPVWKSTYRIVLSSKTGKKPLLQGWAIVDNTVGQDWDNVQLSLVAGAPQSFVQNLSQPYYARRPVVGLPENVAVSPQTHESTLILGGGVLSGRVLDQSGGVIVNAVVRAFDVSGTPEGEARTDADGIYEFQTLPEGPVRLEVDAQGFQHTIVTGVAGSTARPGRQDMNMALGSPTQTVTVNADMPLMQTSVSSFALTANSRSAGTGGALGNGTALGSNRQVTGGGIGSGSGSGIGPGSGGGVGGGVYRVGGGTYQVAAVAQELGDLFEYKLKDQITIPKNRSALVPIVQSEIAAEKVSIWNDRVGVPRPQNALWLTNTSGNTLDGGSFSVMEEDTFAGEGIFEPIRPGEKRLVSYALDLALNASSKNSSETQRVTRVTVSRGVMRHTSEVREKKTYTFRNEDTSPRSVIVEHPVRRGYELRGNLHAEETTADWMRFRLHVEPKQTASLVVEEARPVETTYQLSNINTEQVDLFVHQQSIDKTVEEALRKVLAQKSAIGDLDDQKEARDNETTKIYDDQQRLRENMKALKGTAEEKLLLQRYTQQLNEQETRLEVLRKEIAQLEQRSDAAQEALDKTIAELSFDVTL